MGTSRSSIPVYDEHAVTADSCQKAVETKLKSVGLVDDGRVAARYAAGVKPSVEIAMPVLNGSDAGAPAGFCADCSEWKLAEEPLTRGGRGSIDAQEKERSCNARELHDDIVQRVAMLMERMDQWDQHVPESADEAHDHVLEVRRCLSDVMKYVEVLSDRLHSSHLESQDLEGETARSCRESSEQRRLLNRRLERENICLREEIKLEHNHSTVIGHSPAIRAVLRGAEQVAATDSTVLILGETGTGKELIAQTIHELSGRSTRPMVKINCAALPATLIESELFGREKGAYTGALAKEIGRFELADESTIFLDEIGELPPEVQSKLLRVLQEGQFERLGSSKTIHVNVRVIAATSRNLRTMVKEGKFREDLFYRLNVFPILIPPLRERPEDIPALVWHILEELGKRMGRNVEGVQAATMREFQSYPWPGNIRELRNIIERNLITSAGPVFHAEVIELEPNSKVGMRRLVDVEAGLFRSVLEVARWRVRGKGGAAEVLGLKPTTLEAKMKKLGIQRPN